MLLVTFHGGSSGINDVYAYDTPGGTLATAAALAQPSSGTLSELRAMVLANGLLYVANGAKSSSTVLAYALPGSGVSSSGPLFTNPSTLIGPTLSKKGHFETSIAHPFGIGFADATTCYISNQDTNVVGQVTVSGDGLSGSLGSGCQSAYLNKQFTDGTFLDGTYVASQVGSLHDVSVDATPVPQSDGGLGVTLDNGKVKNSVRDVAIANGILLVCDEPDKIVSLYSLSDGSYLGSSNPLGGAPTHLAVNNGGLYVSAGSALYWGQLPQSPQSASLALQQVALTPPAGNKIGGISFDEGAPATVYIPFQEGTGKAVGGSIFSYDVTQQNPSALPVLSNGAAFVSAGTFADTPEFVLYWSSGS
jgi:hypothetical protein